MAQECPRCGLASPETAQRCDCGYDFSSRTMKESYLVTRVLRQRSVGVIGGVFLCVAWFALYAATLGFVARAVCDHVLQSCDGYGALIALWGYPLTMPGAFAISLVVLVAGKKWLFLGLAPTIAVGVAIIFAFG